MAGCQKVTTENLTSWTLLRREKAPKTNFLRCPLAVLKRKRDDSVLTIQYHEFDGLQPGIERFELFSRFFT